MKLTSATIATSIAGLVCAGALIAPQADAQPIGSRAVAGGRTAGDTLFPNQGNSGYDVRHYDLDIAYAASGEITATATIEASVTAAQALSEFSLDLEGLTVSAVTVNDQAAVFSRVQDEATSTYKLIVTPATPVSGTYTTVVDYSGTPTSHTDPDGSTEGWTRTTSGGVVALNEPVGSMTWFPNNNNPRDKATFTTALTVPYLALEVPGLPANQTAASTGVLESVTVDGNTRTFTWEQPNQQATYLSLVAIGTYTTATGNVPLTVGTTPEWSYANSLIAPASGFTAAREKLSPILRNLESRYGTYPGASTGLVVDSSNLGYALETQDRPYFENTIGQNILIHELAHQWFGNAVSPTDWSDIWLNEGPATFVPIQVESELYGGPSTEDFFYDAWNTTAADSTFWDNPIAGFTDPALLFNQANYDRGAMTLEAMRTALGEEVFTEIMSTWIDRYAGGDASTAEWIALSEEISGFDLTAFFQDWLYDTDKPAWPSRWSLDLTSTPASGASVGAGDAVTIALSATNEGKVAQSGSVVSLDASSLLDQADLGVLPGGVTRSGSTLTWTVPDNALGATTTVTIPATITSPPASAAPITLTATPETLGATCGVCATTLAVDGPDALSPAPTPTIAGLARTDQRLRATIGSWAQGTALTYQWRRDGAPITGATGTTYDVAARDVGSRLTIAVTGTKAGFTPLTRVSAPTDLVAQALQSKRKRPRIGGIPQVGRTLRALVGARDVGTTTTYQWFAGTQTIRGATSMRYVVRPRMKGKRLTVVTTTTKPGYVTVKKISKPTERVTRRR